MKMMEKKIITKATGSAVDDIVIVSGRPETEESEIEILCISKTFKAWLYD